METKRKPTALGFEGPLIWRKTQMFMFHQDIMGNWRSFPAFVGEFSELSMSLSPKWTIDQRELGGPAKHSDSTVVPQIIPPIQSFCKTKSANKSSFLDGYDIKGTTPGARNKAGWDVVASRQEESQGSLKAPRTRPKIPKPWHSCRCWWERNPNTR